MDQYLEDSWLEAQERYGTLESYVRRSDAAAPDGDLNYIQDLYSSWILLTYAAYESAISQFGKAAIRVLATHAATPEQLPEVIRESHLKRTLVFANELVGKSNPRERGLVDPEELVKRAYSAEWSVDSILLRLDRNAWPSNVREWLERVGVSGESLRWMKEPWELGSETMESRVASLVQERNDLAHGVRPSVVLSADRMIEWVRVVREFARRVVGCLQSKLSESMSLDLEPIGAVGDVALGPNTVAIAELSVALQTDGHVLCRDQAGRVRLARIISMQHDGATVQHASTGMKRLAITLNRPIEGLDFFAPV